MVLPISGNPPIHPLKQTTKPSTPVFERFFTPSAPAIAGSSRLIGYLNPNKHPVAFASIISLTVATLALLSLFGATEALIIAAIALAGAAILGYGLYSAYTIYTHTPEKTLNTALKVAGVVALSFLAAGTGIITLGLATFPILRALQEMNKNLLPIDQAKHAEGVLTQLKAIDESIARVIEKESECGPKKANPNMEIFKKQILQLVKTLKKLPLNSKGQHAQKIRDELKLVLERASVTLRDNYTGGGAPCRLHYSFADAGTLRDQIITPISAALDRETNGKKELEEADLILTALETELDTKKAIYVPESLSLSNRTLVRSELIAKKATLLIPVEVDTAIAEVKQTKNTMAITIIEQVCDKDTGLISDQLLQKLLLSARTTLREAQTVDDKKTLKLVIKKLQDLIQIAKASAKDIEIFIKEIQLLTITSIHN